VLAYSIDQTAAAAVLPSARTWALDDTLTWLTVVNDLLGSIGYMGMFSDWNGRLVAQPYTTPAARGSEWTYTADDQAIHGLTGTVASDFYSTPNRWVFYQSNLTDGSSPVEGAGIYTFINTDRGVTSVTARGGRTISRVQGVDAADQASLVATAQQSIDSDMQVGTLVTTESGPNPLHWHADRITVDDPSVGPTAEYLASDWTLDLPTGGMQHTWRQLS
jgi:hypothetical protein